MKTGMMFEKYNAFMKGERGEGGEYKPQVAFLNFFSLTSLFALWIRLGLVGRMELC